MKFAAIFLVFILINVLFNNDSNASNNENELREEFRTIHQEITLLREENRNQNLEISKMKEKDELQDQTILRLQKLTDQLILESVTADLHTPSRMDRRKRPARLLPLQVLFGKNRTDDIRNPPRFFGPPTNCTELAKLGYTLNGYYVVKSVNSRKEEPELEAIYCPFRNPEGTSLLNSSLVDKRLSLCSKPSDSKSGGVYFWTKTFRDITVSEKSIIVLSWVQLNWGNAYNSTSGIFTAPKLGFYRFNLRGWMSYSRGKAPDTPFVSLSLNNVAQHIEYVSLDDKDVPMNVLIDITLKLKPGDRVYLKTNMWQAKVYSHNSWFSGSLLQELDN